MDNYDIFLDENDREDWINLTEPIFPLSERQQKEDSLCEEKKEDKSDKRGIKSPVLTFQLIVSLLFIISILIIKSFLPELYYKLVHFYDAQMSKSMYSDGDFSSLDYSLFFSSTADETEHD